MAETHKHPLLVGCTFIQYGSDPCTMRLQQNPSEIQGKWLFLQFQLRIGIRFANQLCKRFVAELFLQEMDRQEMLSESSAAKASTRDLRRSIDYPAIQRKLQFGN